MKCSVSISLLLSQFFVCILCLAQEDEIARQKKILPTLKDTARIDCLDQIGVQYLWQRNQDSAIFYTNLQYDESKKINYIHGIATTYLHKVILVCRSSGYCYQMEQMADEAIKWFQLTPNKKDLAVAYSLLSRAQWIQCKYDEALHNAKLCYEWAKKVKGDESWTEDALETMSNIYREKGDYDKLFDVQYEIIKTERTPGDTIEYTHHELWVMGFVYILLEEYSTALPFWRKLYSGDKLQQYSILNRAEYAQLLTLSNEPDSALFYYNQFDSARADTEDLPIFLVGKGEYFFFLKQYSVALPYFLQGLIYYKKINDLTQVKRTLLDIAKTYLALQCNDSARNYARQGLAMAIAVKSRPAIRDGYQILSAVYDHWGQADSANYYFRKFISAKDSTLGDQTKARFAAYRYQQKVALLDKERVSQSQQLQRAKTNRNILIVALAVGLVLALFFIRNIRLKRRKDQLQHLMTDAQAQLENKKKEQQLSEMQHQKKELEMQALRAQMNPHFIFNSLNSINMFILENNKLQASEYLSKFSKLVRLILQNSEEPFIPLERELEALELYLQLEALRFDYKFEFRISLSNEVDTVASEVPPLIIQPYAENAIWHGLMHKKEKGLLEIELHQQENTLICKITDDGVGRAKAEELKTKSDSKRKSVGIKITETRIASIQTNTVRAVEVKDLVFTDGSAAGTEVTLKIPVRVNKQSHAD